MATNPWAIGLDQAGTLPAVFRARAAASAEHPAYMQFDAPTQRWRDYSWGETVGAVRRWQAALEREGLEHGDRVAVLCRNRWEWVVFDQAALGLGLVTVPLYPNDRAENIAWILADAGVRLLLLESTAQWPALHHLRDRVPSLHRVLTLDPVAPDDEPQPVAAWLGLARAELAHQSIAPDDLATIVYTSGTTGRPKGVMLTHRNILWNIHACLARFEVRPDDLLLSFLPLSHTLERTVGYYLPLVTGSTIAYTRGIAQLADDLVAVKPTLMISVPRIFERVYRKISDQLAASPGLKRRLFQAAVDIGWEGHQQRRRAGPWRPRQLLAPLLDRLVAKQVRARLGGRLRFTVCGGAALAPEIARFFIGLGIPVVQGYGLTETSPVIAANRLDDNAPETVGPPLAGVEIRVDERGELLTRSPSLTPGYWHNPAATDQLIDAEGWLHTGDKVELDAAGRIRITGRLKEIIVLSTGEKVPPAELENAIVLDGMFDQVILIGEGRPYLSALVVPNPEQFASLASGLRLDPANEATCCNDQVRSLMLERLQRRLVTFPGHAQVHGLAVVRDPWTPENGFMTPTLKLRRKEILTHYRQITEQLYAGH